MFQLRENRSTFVLYGLLMSALALAAFGRLSGHLFDTDDFEYLADAARIQQHPSLFFSPQRSMPGRPLVDLVFLGTRALWGEDPAAYHLLLIALHLSASLLLAHSFRRLGAGLELSLAGALLFLVNVAHFRVLQWISCLAYPLALILGLGALLCQLRFAESQRRRWLAGTVLMLVLAVLSHPAAIALGPFCVYLAWRRGQSARAQALSGWLPALLAGLGVVSLYLAYPRASQMLGMGLWPQLEEAPARLLRYVGQELAWAHWLPADMPWGPEAAGRGYLLLGLLSGALLCTLRRRTEAAAMDWALWSLLLLLPFLPRGFDGLSRYLYFSSAGTSLLLAWVLRAGARRIHQHLNPRCGQLVFVLALAALVASSLEALKRSEVLALYSSGRSYIARGMHRVGATQLEAALARDEGMVPEDIYRRLAMAGFMGGKSEREALEKGLARYPRAAELRMLLGVSSFLDDQAEGRRRGEAQIRAAFEATADKEALRRYTATAFYNLGYYYHYEAGLHQRAVAFFLSALRLYGNYPGALLSLGNALHAQGRAAEALAAFRAAIKMRPDYAAAYRNLGVVLAAQGRLAEAVGALEEAVALEPDNAESRYLLSRLRQYVENEDRARFSAASFAYLLAR